MKNRFRKVKKVSFLKYSYIICIYSVSHEKNFSETCLNVFRHFRSERAYMFLDTPLLNAVGYYLFPIIMGLGN